MQILITGYSGFIGRRLALALADSGHRLVCAGRSAPPLELQGRVTFVRKDFVHDVAVEDWLPVLAGVDAVINAAGLLSGRGASELERVHLRGPAALFGACAAVGIRRVVQVSALGADADAQSAYHRTKRAADDLLRRLLPDAVIVQPSLVYGRGGASAALFAGLASAPVTPLPGDGLQRVQPVHVDDAVAGIVALLANPELRGATIAFVGPEPLTLRGFLAELRAALGLGRPRFVNVPLALVRIAARFGTLTRRGLLNDETLGMLLRGNVADAQPLERLLQRPPRPVGRFVDTATRDLDRRDASLHWLVPPLRWSIALMWLVSGSVSLGPYPVEESLHLLAAVGITAEPLARAALYGAAVLDLAFGVATLAVRRRRLLWAAQIAVVLAYTAIISLHLPELWLEPFGPILKNVPILAVLWLLYATEERRWST